MRLVPWLQGHPLMLRHRELQQLGPATGRVGGHPAARRRRRHGDDSGGRCVHGRHDISSGRRRVDGRRLRPPPPAGGRVLRDHAHRRRRPDDVPESSAVDIEVEDKDNCRRLQPASRRHRNLLAEKGGMQVCQPSRSVCSRIAPIPRATRAIADSAATTARATPARWGSARRAASRWRCRAAFPESRSTPRWFTGLKKSARARSGAGAYRQSPSPAATPFPSGAARDARGIVVDLTHLCCRSTTVARLGRHRAPLLHDRRASVARPRRLERRWRHRRAPSAITQRFAERVLKVDSTSGSVNRDAHPRDGGSRSSPLAAGPAHAHQPSRSTCHERPAGSKLQLGRQRRVRQQGNARLESCAGLPSTPSRSPRPEPSRHRGRRYERRTGRTAPIRTVP